MNIGAHSLVLYGRDVEPAIERRDCRTLLDPGEVEIGLPRTSRELSVISSQSSVFFVLGDQQHLPRRLPRLERGMRLGRSSQWKRSVHPHSQPALADPA